MSAGLSTLQNWATKELAGHLQTGLVYLVGQRNEVIAGGGYAPVALTGGIAQFEFTGETPWIYGYQLRMGDSIIYGESFPQPWRALNAGDILEVTIHCAVTTRKKR